jgi:polar amino acid transport system substrate-binding protein
VRVSRVTAVALAVVLVASAVGLAGCGAGIGAQAAPKPSLAPPAIAKAGELSVAVDMSYPPFAAKMGEDRAGWDIDVAAAIADRLGLKLVLVDAKPDAAAKLLRARKVDLVMGDLTIARALDLEVAFAGSYTSDAPAVFASKGTTVSSDALGGKRIAVQKGAEAYWLLSDTYGDQALMLFPTLREAMGAVTGGQADVVAGDALVGGYMLRDFPKLALAGQLAQAAPVGVGVSKDDPKLEDAVRRALDEMSSQGILATLRRKWVGDLPQLKAPGAETTPTAETTPAP